MLADCSLTALPITCSKLYFLSEFRSQTRRELMSLLVFENTKISHRKKIFNLFGVDYYITKWPWVNLPLMLSVGIVYALLFSPETSSFWKYWEVFVRTVDSQIISSAGTTVWDNPMLALCARLCPFKVRQNAWNCNQAIHRPIQPITYYIITT